VSELLTKRPAAGHHAHHPGLLRRSSEVDPRPKYRPSPVEPGANRAPPPGSNPPSRACSALSSWKGVDQATYEPESIFDACMEAALDRIKSLDHNLGFDRDKLIVHLPPDMSSGGGCPR
jgi:hypothetical protein